MQISLVHITQTGAQAQDLTLDAGATVLMALSAAKIEFSIGLGFSVYGRRVTKDTVLNDGDRLEVAEALVIDPKTRRDRRAQEQGDVRLLTRGRHMGNHRKING